MICERGDPPKLAGLKSKRNTPHSFRSLLPASVPFQRTSIVAVPRPFPADVAPVGPTPEVFSVTLPSAPAPTLVLTWINAQCAVDALNAKTKAKESDAKLRFHVNKFLFIRYPLESNGL